MTPRIVPPAGATAREPRPLRLDEVPGAELESHHEWLLGDAVLTVACVTRPVPLWLDGLAPAALAGMSGMVRRHLGLAVLHPAEVRRVDAAWRQTFEGRGGTSQVLGTHQLGFASPRELLACASVCEAETRASCEAATASLQVEPGFVSRSPSALERGLSVCLEAPRVVVGLTLALLLASVVWLLARRPRTG